MKATAITEMAKKRKFKKGCPERGIIMVEIEIDKDNVLDVLQELKIQVEQDAKKVGLLSQYKVKVNPFPYKLRFDDINETLFHVLIYLETQNDNFT